MVSLKRQRGFTTIATLLAFLSVGLVFALMNASYPQAERAGMSRTRSIAGRGMEEAVGHFHADRPFRPGAEHLCPEPPAGSRLLGAHPAIV